MQTFAKNGLLFAAAFLVFGCGKKDAEEVTQTALKSTQASAILEYVPADTPYFAGKLEPVSDKVMKKLQPMTEDVIKIYGKILTDVVSQAAKKDDDDAEKANAFMDVLGEELKDGNLDGFGIDLNARVALYGQGLLPVLRMDLADSDKFEAAIARLEKESGESMDVAEIDGQSYRSIGNDEANFLLAVFDGQFVATMAPANASPELLKQVLGISKPAKNLGDTDKLTNLSSKYGYLPQSIGFLDTLELVETFVTEPNGVNKELFATGKYDSSELSDVCKAEYRELAGVMPSISFGTTSQTPDRADAKMVFELRPDLAASLKPIATSVPGVGGNMGGMFAYGLSLNIEAALDFMSDRVKALEEKPYQCEKLASLQQSGAGMQQALSSPLPPFVNNFKGAAFVVDDIKKMDFSGGQPPEVEFRALISMDDAPGLLMMGQMFVPALGQVQLEPNGEVTALPSDIVPGNDQPVFVALTDSAILLGLGAATEDKLTPMLNAASPDVPPLQSFSYDMAAYMQFIGKAMDEAAKQGGDSEVNMADMKDLFDTLGKYFDRTWMDVTATDNGIEVPYSITFK
ncbi:MAG: hypothetical protein AAF385_12670 [Pseudomonadota bacterium]